jgi:CBS domain containing-hemolysin-like protein
MIPRKEITAVEYDTTPEAILEQVVLDGYTRMPVYKGSLDYIIGVIYAKDVVSLIEHKDLIILDDIIRPPFVVPDTKPISDLLREFQRKRIHLAVVVDEFGGTEGLITLEDILEEIVGDIHDEYDEDARYWDMLPGGVVEVEGRLTISDFNALFPITIPESDEYDTIGGFITSLMGRIPEKEDGTDWHGFRIDILDVDGRRIVRARFTPLEDAQA